MTNLLLVRRIRIVVQNHSIRLVALHSKYNEAYDTPDLVIPIDRKMWWEGHRSTWMPTSEINPIRMVKMHIEPECTYKWAEYDLPPLEFRWLCFVVRDRNKHSCICIDCVAVGLPSLLDFVGHSYWRGNEVPMWWQSSRTHYNTPKPTRDLSHRYCFECDKANIVLATSRNKRNWLKERHTSLGNALPSSFRRKSLKSSNNESNAPHGLRLWHEYKIDIFFKLTFTLNISSSSGISSPAIRLRQSSIASR